MILTWKMELVRS